MQNCALALATRLQLDKRLCLLIIIVCFVVCFPEQFEMQETERKL